MRRSGRCAPSNPERAQSIPLGIGQHRAPDFLFRLFYILLRPSRAFASRMCILLPSAEWL